MRQNALIDIAMLIDTRYGTLLQIDPEAAVEIVKDEWYLTRDTDDFEKVSGGKLTNAAYKELYAKHDVKSLVYGVMTDFVVNLRTDIKQGIGDIERIHSDVVFSLEVNTFPFDLLPQETEVIKVAIERLLPVSAEVKMVYIDWRDLTPPILTSRYEMMAIYNYEDWLSHHVDGLSQHPITDFCLITPRIAVSGVVPKPSKDVGDPFMALPMVMSRYIQIIQVPSGWVCCNYKVFLSLGVDITDFGQ